MDVRKLIFHRTTVQYFMLTYSVCVTELVRCQDHSHAFIGGAFTSSPKIS